MRKVLASVPYVVVGTVLAVLLVCALLLLGKSPRDAGAQTKEAPAEVLKTQTSEGVLLNGCGFQDFTDNGWIENTLGHPVRIRQVWQRDHGGEITNSMYLLGPGAKFKIKDIDYHLGFYIYNSEGGLIGWISGACPEH